MATERIAELEREIAELERRYAATPETARGARGDLLAQIGDARAELSRLRPKGGGAVDREAEAALARQEAIKGQPWPTERLAQDLVAAGESEYAAPSPATSLGAQDVRAEIASIVKAHIGSVCSDGNSNPAPLASEIADAILSVFPALGQSDAQPEKPVYCLGWNTIETVRKHGELDTSLVTFIAASDLMNSDAQPVLYQYRLKSPGSKWKNCEAETDIYYRHSPTEYEIRPLYTAPPRPDASAGLIDGLANDLGFAEWATPEHAEEILRELIAEYYATLRTAADRSAT